MPKINIEKSILIKKSVSDVFKILNDFNTWSTWSPWLILEKDVKVNVLEEGKFYEWEGDTVFQIVQKLTNTQWKLVRRIQVPLPNQHISSSVMKWARENCQMVNTDRDLLVFQIN